MSTEGECSPAPGAGAAAGAGAGAGEARPVHPRSFKLRFAAQREPGRSYVSLVKPLGLPATVTGKFYSGCVARGARGARGGTADAAAGSAEEAHVESALRRIRDMFRLGPRERFHAPITSAHECGWWWREGLAAERETARAVERHHVRESAWLKARLQVLAADHRLKRN